MRSTDHGSSFASQSIWRTISAHRFVEHIYSIMSFVFSSSADQFFSLLQLGLVLLLLLPQPPLNAKCSMHRCACDRFVGLENDSFVSLSAVAIMHASNRSYSIL